jgi:LysR family transcriptional regulator, nitrogen assimilation regulatory protein
MKVVEVGNMTRAADLLHVAQPALGLQIKQLERDLGVALLVRHSRGVVPTNAGKLLHERAQAIVKLVDDSSREVKALGSLTRETIVLGLTPSIMMQLGSDILLDARDEMPEVFLSLVEEMSHVLIAALERGELDMALAYEVADLPGVSRTPILEEELLLVTAPDSAPRGKTIALAKALERDLVQAGERDMIRRLIHTAAEEMSLPVKIAFEAQSVAAMKDIAARGLAASIIPFGTAVEELKRGTLIGRRIEQPAIKRTLYLVRPKQRPPFKHEAAFAKFLTRTLRRLLESLGPLAHKLDDPAHVSDLTK